MNFRNILFALFAVVAFTFIACSTDDEVVPEVCPSCVEGIDTITIAAGWNYEAKYGTVEGKQLHYIDEEGEGDYTFVFIHGLPTWSYLWRNVMPHLQKRGRIVAIDLVGHGKSDKPDMDYTIGNITDLAVKQLDQLNLGDNIILVVQDWGGPVGFEYARQNPERVKGMAFFETIWAPVPSFDVFPPDFAQFQQFIRSGEEGDNTPGSSWDQMVNQAFILEQLVPGLIFQHRLGRHPEDSGRRLANNVSHKLNKQPLHECTIVFIRNTSTRKSTTRIVRTKTKRLKGNTDRLQIGTASNNQQNCS